MVKYKFKTFSVVQIAALVCALLLYSGMLKPEAFSPFCSIIDADTISCIKGIIASNPVITSKRNYYFIKIQLQSVFHEDSVSNAEGYADVLCPKEIIESHYPGKLYDTKGTVFEQGALVELSGKNIDEIFVCSKAKHIGWQNNFCKWRAKFRLQFKRIMFRWGDCGGLLLALLSGSREYTNPKLSEAFRLSGLSHVLALSGMHLSFFSGLALNSTKRIFGKNKAVIFSIFLVLFFVWFAGLSPSLFRALLCFFIISFTNYLNLKINMLSVLSLSFLVQIIFRTQDAFSVSFMLSYSSLFGITLFSNFFNKYFSFIMIPKMSNAFSVSISAQTFTSVITVFIFHMLTPIGIFSSVLTSSLFNVFLLSGFLLVVLTLLFPALINVSGLLLNCIYIIIEKSVSFFAQFSPVIIN